MKNSQILDITHRLIKSYITDDDVAVDMTMGNGYDMLFLAQNSKFVYGFDIQKPALENTLNLLKKHNINNTKCILDSHENILKYVTYFKYVIYNLGYLPNGDKTITTYYQSTLDSLALVLDHIDDQGIVFLMVYPGHLEGSKESIYLDKYLETLNPHAFKIVKTYLPYQNNKPPYLLTIYKTKRT